MSDKQDEKEIKVTDKRRVTAETDIPQQEPAAETGPVAQPEAADTPNGPEAEFAAEPPDGSAGEEHSAADLPVTFLSLIFSLASSAMMYLGDVADTEGKSLKDITMAKQTIDLLGILSEKTRGNLTKDEEQFLSVTLRDLRLRFVQARK